MKSIIWTGLFGLTLGLASAVAVAQENGPRPAPAESVDSARGPGGWEVVGGQSAPAAKPVQLRRAHTVPRPPDDLQARKAEMVRRMFWIALAHR